MRIKPSVRNLLMPLISFIISISIGSCTYMPANGYQNPSIPPASIYPENQYGESYGSALYATSPETEPDLILAYGVDGTIGYVRSTDLRGVQPKTPEEALAQQAKESNGREIPLYDVSGKKVIGKFKIQPGNAITIK